MRQFVPAFSLLFAVLLVSQTVLGQKPIFEVASVKANLSGNGSLGTTPGRFIATGVPLRLLLKEAYSLMDAQIADGPGWINLDRWDVEGKAKAGDADGSQIMQMVQSLIEERFQLRFHRETRELPIYELTVSKGGTKMKVSTNPDAPRGRMGRGSIEGTAWSIANLIKFLSQQLDRPLMDKTDLWGLYDMKLQWSPALGPGGGAPSDQTRPFYCGSGTAWLEIRCNEGPVEVLVIDSVQKPAEN